MATVEGVPKLKAALEKLIRRSRQVDSGNVIVGFNAFYALFVHENVEMKWRGQKRKGTRPDGSKRRGKYWDPQGRGQSKFLEQPAREMKPEIAATIAANARRGAGLIKAMVVAGQRLQAASQKLVPVDLGNLKGSAFTEIE
jgi:hypothetical protein